MSCLNYLYSYELVTNITISLFKVFTHELCNDTDVHNVHIYYVPVCTVGELFTSNISPH